MKDIKQDGEIKSINMAKAGQVYTLRPSVARNSISRDKGQDRNPVQVDPGEESGGLNRS